jgi:type III restriction enzyme
MITLKDYQRRSLSALTDYFIAFQQDESADRAFASVTRQSFGAALSYREVKELPGLPYICLRMPTGGGKTIVASHAIGIAAKELLHTETPVVLWLVPSNTIKEQTCNALKDRSHPYRQAVEESMPSVAVLTMPEALYVTRPTLANNATIIVSTIQAFRVDETEGRKVYEQSGVLMEHFTDLDAALAETLESYENGAPIQSLANLLKMHRPIVIVDEAHNSRTQLSFETLARFNPSCIIEFTATPATEHNPSNILYSVSAAELKAAQMIKMPIRLETRPNWKELLTDAIALRKHLEQVAIEEKLETGEYIRPIMLIQAQARSQTCETLTVEVVEQCLIDDFNIPPDQIRRATGTDKGLEGLDLAVSGCVVRFIITVQALREGWDCPFAYVLCSVAEMRSSTAVEQILGRIMRLHHAKRKQHEELNMAYAFSASKNFVEAANALEDALIQNGFNRQEAKELITRMPQREQGDLDLFYKVSEPLADAPLLAGLPETVAQKFTYDEASKTCTFVGIMEEPEKYAILDCCKTPEARATIERLYRKSCGIPLEQSKTPSERGVPFSIPLLSVQQGDLFEPFEESHFLEIPWRLSKYPPTFTESDYSTKQFDGKVIDIDVDDRGKVSKSFLKELRHQISFLEPDTKESVAGLVHWIDKNIPNRADILPSESGPYIIGVIHYLLNERNISLQELFHDKYTLRQKIVTKIETLRKAERLKAYQTFLLPECATPIVVTPSLCFTFKPNEYPCNAKYQGSYKFQKHYYKDIASLNGEEEECAIYIDQLPAVDCWVRNIERREFLSFWLQTSTDKFYPDFVCKLKDGRFLVVEYKSETSWSNEDSKEKRALGELWEKRSNGTCLFMMPKGRDLAAIGGKVGSEV